MRIGPLEASVAATFALCALVLIAVAALTTSPRSFVPERPTEEEQARLIAEKEAWMQREEVFRRFEVVVGIAGLGLGVSAATLAIRVGRRPRPARTQVMVGIALAILGPLVAWTGYWLIASRGGVLPEGAGLLPVAGVILAALGFVVAGTGLRPSGSGVRGGVLGAVLYASTGVLWLFGFHLAVGGNLIGLARALFDPISFFVAVIFWPLQVASTLGLFGLTFGS